MILRPSKIFVSFHQVRHYFQTKISELVVTSHQQPSHTVTQLANFSTTQQSILFFSEIQHSLIQKACHIQQPVRSNLVNEKVLLKVIQRHFPIVKVFSQPTLYGRNMLWTNTYPSQQLRTMMSSSGGTGGGSSLLTFGLPRTAMVGVGRNHGFGATRQFSTTKSSTCVNLFQNTTSHQPNIFAHVSSRIFSPAGTKMNQPVTAEEKPKYVPFYSREQDVSSGEESICSGDYRTSRVFPQRCNTGMVGAIGNDLQTESSESILAGEDSTEIRQKHSKRSTKKFDHIIRHDEISALHNEETTIPKKSKRKLHSICTHTQNGRTKHPPRHTQRHHVKKEPLCEDDSKKRAANVYMLIVLDSTPFLSTWSTQRLNSDFIDAVETLAQNYQKRIQHILNFLERLRFSGQKFRVVARQSELRIYFPTSSSVQTEEEASEFLKGLQVEKEEDYYSIIVERDEENLTYGDHNHDHIVGPDYFKDLQMFLDRTDYLIQTSDSTFSSSR